MGIRSSKGKVAVDLVPLSESKDQQSERTIDIYGSAYEYSGREGCRKKPTPPPKDLQKVLSLTVNVAELKRKTSEPNLLPSQKSNKQSPIKRSPKYACNLRKETSDPQLYHDDSVEILKRLPSVDVEDCAFGEGEFNNRKYWFMQNSDFQRKTSFDSLELGVQIAKELAGTYHEQKVLENNERLRIKEKAATSVISATGGYIFYCLTMCCCCSLLVMKSIVNLCCWYSRKSTTKRTAADTKCSKDDT